MWPNPQETPDLVTLKKSLMENFIFCAVYLKNELWNEVVFLHVSRQIQLFYVIQFIYMGVAEPICLK